MNNDINLVSADSINSLGNKLQNRVKTAGVVSLLMVGFLSIILFGLNRLFSPQSIIDEQGRLVASMASDNTKQIKLFLLSQRVNDSSTIISKRNNYDVILGSIFSKSGSNVSVASLSVDKKKISLILNSSSLLYLNDFIENLKGMVEKKQFIKNVTVNNLNLGNAKTGYVLDLSIEIL